MSLPQRSVKQPEFKGEKEVKLPCTRIAFGGGGAPGVFAHAQVIKELRRYIDYSNVKTVAGVSVGSIAALIFALNYTDSDIDIFFGSLNLSAVDDGGWILSKLSRLKNRLGLFKGDELAKIIRKILKFKGFDENSTFNDLHNARNADGSLKCKDLYVTVTRMLKDKNIARSEKVYCSYKTHGNTSVADIIHASSSATPFFPPVVFEDKGNGRLVLIKDKDKTKGHYSYTDGGWTENDPLRLFDQQEFLDESTHVIKTEVNGKIICTNMEAIAITLYDPPPATTGSSDKTPIDTDDIANTTFALLSARVEPELLTVLNTPELLTRTILINRCGLSLQDFAAPPEKREGVRQATIRAVRTFVSNRAQKLSYEETLAAFMNVIVRRKAPAEEKIKPGDLFGADKPILPPRALVISREEENRIRHFLGETEISEPLPPSNPEIKIGPDSRKLLKTTTTSADEAPLGKRPVPQFASLKPLAINLGSADERKKNASVAPPSKYDSFTLQRAYLRKEAAGAIKKKTEKEQKSDKLLAHTSRATVNLVKPTEEKRMPVVEVIPLVPLENGSEHAKADVMEIMDSLNSLRDSFTGRVALFDLVQHCRLPSQEIEPKCKDILNGRKLLTDDPKRSKLIRDVILSAAIGDDLFSLKLKSPFAEVSLKLTP